jgi:hypothetical protein
MPAGPPRIAVWIASAMAGATLIATQWHGLVAAIKGASSPSSAAAAKADEDSKFGGELAKQRAAFGLVGAPSAQVLGKFGADVPQLPFAVPAGGCVKLFAFTKAKNRVAVDLAPTAPADADYVVTPIRQPNFELDRICRKAGSDLPMAAHLNLARGSGKFAIEVYPL